MESVRKSHQLALDCPDLVEAIREQAEKRQRQQIYESFMRVMALERELWTRSSGGPRFGPDWRAAPQRRTFHAARRFASGHMTNAGPASQTGFIARSRAELIDVSLDLAAKSAKEPDRHKAKDLSDQALQLWQAARES